MVEWSKIIRKIRMRLVHSDPLDAQICAFKLHDDNREQ